VLVQVVDIVTTVLLRFK